MSEPYAVLQIKQEPEDDSWTITDITRPGFVVADSTLRKALRDVPEVIQLWDEAAVEAGTTREEALAFYVLEGAVIDGKEHTDERPVEAGAEVRPVVPARRARGRSRAVRERGRTR